MKLTICPVNANNKLKEIKKYVYEYFKVSNTKALKKLKVLEGDFRLKATWLKLADLAHIFNLKDIKRSQIYTPIQANTLEDLFQEAQYRMDYIFSNPLYSS